MLAVLAAAACYPIVLFDRVPLGTGEILGEPPWAAARPDDFATVSSPLGDLQTRQYYPWYALLNDAARHGDSLLWNPLEGCGQPFLALWRTRCLSPFSLPFYVMATPSRAVQVSVLLKLFVAGLCAYYAARKFGFTPPVALFVGVAFELSGPVFLWVGTPMSDVVAWLPLWLVCAERLLVGQARYWPLGAVVVALMALGGDPESLAVATLFTVLFMVIRVVLSGARPKTGRASTLALLASVGVGGALVAVQVGPFIEFLGEAAVTGRPASTATLRFSDLVLCLLPHFFGAHAGMIAGGDRVASLAVLKLLHVGWVPILLVLLWFALRHSVAEFQRHRIEALLATAVVMTLVPLAAGDALSRIPVLGRLNAEHFLVGNALAFALVAAAAVEEWLELNADQCKRTIMRLLVLTPALVALAATAVWASRGATRLSGAAFVLQVVVAVLIAVGLLAIVVGTLFRPSARVMGASLTGLTFVASLAAFAPGIAYLDREVLFPKTDFVGVLQDRPVRLGGGEALRRWPLAGNLVAQVFCPSGVKLKRQAAVLDRVEADPLLLRRVGAPTLLLTKQDVQGAFATVRSQLDIEQVFSSGAVLLTDREAAPRAWMAYEGRCVDEFDPAALSADLPPLVENAVFSNMAEGPEAAVAIAEPDRYDRVEIRVEDTRPGVLVLADAWYPGWKATIDGTEAPVFPVDGLFRGILVDEGPHDVVFHYDPYSVKAGLAITAGAAVVTLLGFGYLGLRRLRRRRQAL